MPIEIKELVIRANVDRKIFGSESTFTEQEKRELKKEVLAYCLNKLDVKQAVTQKNMGNSIDR